MSCLIKISIIDHLLFCYIKNDICENITIYLSLLSNTVTKAIKTSLSNLLYIYFLIVHKT